MSGPHATDCWVVTDGRAGIENQALGLAEALARIRPVSIVTKRIDVAAPWRHFPAALWGDPFSRLSKRGALLRPPYPAIWIGCGRLSVPLTRAVKRIDPGVFTVQLQAPGGALEDFDLVVPPFHDRVAGENVAAMIGAPNRISEDYIRDDVTHLAPIIEGLGSPRVAVLLGGPNKAFRFGEREGRRLAARLRWLADAGAGLMITPSRRTDPAVTDAIRRALSGRNVFFWAGEPVNGLKNPYAAMLGAASHIIVTADSVNMAAEAAATGKPVHVFQLPGRFGSGGASKFAHFHQSLARYGASKPFKVPLKIWTYEPLRETDRIAAAAWARYDEFRAHAS